MNGRRKREPNSGSMKPGETRNPKGRPRGAKDVKAMVRSVISTKTTGRVNGKARKISIFHALLLKEVELAVQGDWRARKTILELGMWALPEEVAPGQGSSATPSRESDRAIIAWFEDEARALATKNAEALGKNPRTAKRTKA